MYHQHNVQGIHEALFKLIPLNELFLLCEWGGQTEKRDRAIKHYQREAYLFKKGTTN